MAQAMIEGTIVFIEIRGSDAFNKWNKIVE